MYRMSDENEIQFGEIDKVDSEVMIGSPGASKEHKGLKFGKMTKGKSVRVKKPE